MEIARVPGDEPITWPQGEKASRAVRGDLSALDRESAEVAAGSKSRLMSCENHQSSTEKNKSRIGIGRMREE